MEMNDQHQHLEINVVGSGRITYLCGSQRVTLEKGSLLVFWAAQPHKVVSVEGLEYLEWVHIPMSWFLDWSLPRSLVQAVLEGRVLMDRDPDYPDMDASLVRRWVRDIEAGDAKGIDATLLEIRARLRRMRNLDGPPPGDFSGDKDSLMDCAAYISRHFTEPIEVATLASKAGYHPDHLAEIFRKRFGMTIGQCVNRHRVFQAQMLLASTEFRILDIVYEAGFGSVTQFNATFKKYLGVSPREYRLNLRTE